MFLSQSSQRELQGKISSISYSPNKITIKVEAYERDLIIFNKASLNLKKGDLISFSGRLQTYRNKDQMIIDGIKCLSC